MAQTSKHLQKQTLNPDKTLKSHRVYPWKSLYAFRFCACLCLKMSANDMSTFSACFIIMYATIYNIPLRFINCTKNSFDHSTIKESRPMYLLTQLKPVCC